MTINEALQKATQEGYRFSCCAGEAWHHAPADGDTALIGKEFLDPLFWRALGLALEWQKGVEKTCLVYDQWWRQPWHRFIDHLATERTAEAFFETLPTPRID